MKLFTTGQIAEIDRYTIENEPISDIGLMERAAQQLSGWLKSHYPSGCEMIFFAGPGNNGGDALAVARQLSEEGYPCKVLLPDFGRELSASSVINLGRLKAQGKAECILLERNGNFPVISLGAVIIDGLFGSGLTRPLSGFAAEIVNSINQLGNTVVAIDIPSGLMGEDNSGNLGENIIQADFTLTLQFPKISFLFPENERYTGKWIILPIGLHPEGIEQTPSPFRFIEAVDIRGLLPVRKKFAHKGSFGHSLLLSGSYGKMGAAILASRACLRSGTGLLTTHIPGAGYNILQTGIPEAMASIDKNQDEISEIPDLETFSAIGAGPGIGKSNLTASALVQLVENSRVPLVLDADALNIISENPKLLSTIPAGTILTPHPGEFRRLAGDSFDSYQRLMKQIAFSQQYRVIVILKGAYTSVSFPDGTVFFNSTGNPGMATAGSGDVLTGIILGLLSQGVEPRNAALLGVYLHGLAGDLAIEKKSEQSLIASDIIDFLGNAFLAIIP
jgi:ADP-dependent NAD(P)H-hydrate dehydratase / NAD(P)H-hydrate epimerase